MILDLTIIVIWLTSIYRLAILIRQRRTVWRVCFTASIVAAAVALTLRRFHRTIDKAAGLANLAELVNHLILVAGLAVLLIYLDALRMPTLSPRRIRIYAGLAITVAVTITTAWAVAPVHDQGYEDLIPLSWHPAVMVYCLTFWAFLGFAVFMLGWTCLARGRAIRRDDPARSITMVLSGVSGFAAVLMVLLWVVALLTYRQAPQASAAARAVANTMLPWPILLAVIGILGLVIIPYVSALTTALWRWRQLHPLWAALIDRHPEVHLPLTPTGGPLSRAETRTERVIIEIHDALRLTRVDLARPTTTRPLTAVAAALHSRDRGRRRITDLLPRATGREADIRQLVALSQAFRTAKDPR
mgnify:CR=1 FL=1